jgi:HAD superfamily hydrolase (TIGR01509 family)
METIVIESVVFDMDGVLFDTERICINVWYQVGKEMNISDISKAVVGCLGLNVNDTRQFFVSQYQGQFPYAEFMRRTSQLLNETIERDGIPMKAGVFELLEFLKNNKYNIALSTSTSKVDAERYLKKAEITNYFQAIITGDMIEHGKPNPEIYLMACKGLSSSPEVSFAIEDSFYGIRAAYDAGMKPIMVPDLIEPTEEIEKLLYRKFESLLGVKEHLQTIKREYN